MAGNCSNGQRPTEILIGIAGKQHGLLTRGQLLDGGLSRNQIDGRVKSGLLRRVHAGVYQFGTVSPSHARERSALLACNGGTISHWSAAALRRLISQQGGRDPVDVLLSGGQHGGARPGIRVHRGVLGDQEVSDVDGIPVTTIARTILDLGSVSLRDLERVLGAAERIQPDLRDQLATLLARYPKRRGTGTLRTLLADSSSGTFTRSEAENRLLELIRAADLPRPELNAPLFGYEVDCLWREAGLVVEVDGFAFHRSKRAFVRDRQRDSIFIAAGMQVLRLTWRQVTRERERTISQLAQALARRTNPR